MTKFDMKPENIEELKIIIEALRSHPDNKKMLELSDKFQAVVDKYNSRMSKIEERNKRWR